MSDALRSGLIAVLALVAYFALMRGVIGVLTLDRSTLSGVPKSRRARNGSPRTQKRVERRRLPNGDMILMGLEFTSAKKRKEVIEFTLDGELYHFTPHKTASVVLALLGGDQTAQVKETFDWLSDGLPDEESQRIIDKLKDPDDEFDITDLTDVIRGLQEEIAGRPTTSSAASSK